VGWRAGSSPRGSVMETLWWVTLVFELAGCRHGLPVSEGVPGLVRGAMPLTSDHSRRDRKAELPEQQ
jgi:hypothetical protein